MTKMAIRMVEKIVAKARTVMNLLEVDIASGGVVRLVAAAPNGVVEVVAIM